MQKSYGYTPSARVGIGIGVQMQNVRANVKDFGISVFLYFLLLLNFANHTKKALYNKSLQQVHIRWLWHLWFKSIVLLHRFHFVIGLICVSVSILTEMGVQTRAITRFQGRWAGPSSQGTQGLGFIVSQMPISKSCNQELFLLCIIWCFSYVSGFTVWFDFCASKRIQEHLVFGLTVCEINLNFGHNFWTFKRYRDFIIGMHTQFIKHLQVTPMVNDLVTDIDNIVLDFVSAGGVYVSQTHLVFKLAWTNVLWAILIPRRRHAQKL